jgi:Cu(I)/Ag(I) efflux system membrane fusion protein
MEQITPGDSHSEMEHMEAGAQHNETDHMTSGAAHEEHAMLNVKGKCEMCKERIEKAAKSVEGVSFASWEIEKEVLHLNYDPDKTSTDAIAQAIAAVGHDTDKYKAEQATYDALPSCCKYRD